MKITRRTIGMAPTGEPLEVFNLENTAGNSVELCNLGARWIAANVPDRQGRRENVILPPADVASDTYYMGAVVGRVANRIGGARISIDGQSYPLAANDGANINHGGPGAFDSRVWNARELPSGVLFSLESPAGENGFPGTLRVEAEYRWDDTDALSLTFRAVTDAPTCVNLTNHAYFNLKADGSKIHGHLLQIPASQMLETDSCFIPTGRLVDVGSTPFDFTRPKLIGRDMDAGCDQLRWNRGYNHCYLLKQESNHSLVEAACVVEPESGRALTLLTTQESVLLYSAGFLPEPHTALCLETQNWPDSPSHSNFPSCILRPGEVYERYTMYKFSVK